MDDALRALAGQSLMLSFYGPVATPEVLDLLTQTRAGGVILFANNVGTPAELHALTGALQSHAAALGLPPLLIAIDQEGGAVTRFTPPLVTVPSQMAQGATGDPAVAYECARITGSQLRAYGVNTNFAPVLDVNNNPLNPVVGARSFGETPALVAEFGLAAVRGYAETGVLATAKHFPGHGDTQVDSHHGLPVVAHGRERLAATELAPFVAAFGADIPAIMTAHIIFPALDSAPATLSRPILRDLLRDELGYDGIVFTDALEMRAIADMYSPVEAALRSKAAGVDVLLPMGTRDDQIAIATALAEAAESGTIPRTAFESTAERLERARRRFGITHALPPFAEPAAELTERARAVAARSIAVVRGREQLPLAAETKLLLVDCVVPRFSLAEEALERASLMRRLVGAAFPQLDAIALEADAADAAQPEIVRRAAAADAVLLLTRNATHQPWQVELGRALAQSGRPLLHAAVRVPYDVALIPAAAVTLATFGDADVSLGALVDVLSGTALPQGRLPVSLPEEVA